MLPHAQKLHLGREPGAVPFERAQPMLGDLHQLLGGAEQLRPLRLGPGDEVERRSGKDRGAGDDVMMLADGNGDYARALGLEMDATGFGMGMRGQRFALVVNDGVAEHVAVEAPGQFEVSKAESILDAL